MEQSFDKWFYDLQMIYQAHGYPSNIDAEAMRQYYDDDMSPEDAFEEDISYA